MDVTKPKFTTVDEYISMFPHETKCILNPNYALANKKGKLYSLG